MILIVCNDILALELETEGFLGEIIRKLN